MDNISEEIGDEGDGATDNMTSGQGEGEYSANHIPTSFAINYEASTSDTNNDEGGDFNGPSPPEDKHTGIIELLRKTYRQLGGHLKMASEQCSEEFSTLQKAYDSLVQQNQNLAKRLVEMADRHESELQAVRNAAEKEREEWKIYHDKTSENLSALRNQVVDELKQKEELSERLAEKEGEISALTNERDLLKCEKKVAENELDEKKEKLDELEAENKYLKVRVSAMSVELKTEKHSREKSAAELNEMKLKISTATHQLESVTGILRTPKLAVVVIRKLSPEEISKCRRDSSAEDALVSSQQPFEAHQKRKRSISGTQGARKSAKISKDDGGELEVTTGNSSPVVDLTADDTETGGPSANVRSRRREGNEEMVITPNSDSSSHHINLRFS